MAEGDAGGAAGATRDALVRALRPDPLLALVLAAFAAILLANADFIPVFDGRIYADCIVDAAAARLAPVTLTCCDHPDQAFMVPMALAEMLAPGRFLPILLVDVILGVASLACFHAILAHLFPGASRRVERVLLTAAFAFNPVVLAAFLNVNPDNAVLAFFLMTTLALLRRRFMATWLLGTLLCFSKEVGPLLYAMLVAVFVWREAADADGTLGKKVRVALGFWKLVLPCLFFTFWFVVHAMVSDHAMWKGETGGSIVGQLFSFRADDPYTKSYAAGIFVMSFQWLVTAVVALWLGRALLLRLLRLPVSELEGGERKSVVFAVLYFLGTAFLLTRYRTFTNARYWMPVYPAMLLPLVPALEWAVRRVRLRQAYLGVVAALFLLSAFRTVDPMSKKIFKTFDFGERPLLWITSITDECCGFARDQIEYDLEFRHLHHALDEGLVWAAPDDATTLALAPGGNWFLVGHVDRATHTRTISRDGSFMPRVREVQDLAATPVRDLPAEIVFFALPFVDNEPSRRWLLSRYELVELKTVGTGGYTMDVVKLKRRAPPPSAP